jgi:hypothetical protein
VGRRSSDWRQCRKTVLILGGGTRPVAANRLRRMLPGAPGLFSSTARPFTRSLLRSPGSCSAGALAADQPRSRRAEQEGVEVKTGEIQAIDAANKRITVKDDQSSTTTWLSPSGPSTQSTRCPASAEPGRSTTEGAEGLAEQLPKFEGGRLAIVVPSLPTNARLRRTKARSCWTNNSASAACG